MNHLAHEVASGLAARKTLNERITNGGLNPTDKITGDVVNYVKNVLNPKVEGLAEQYALGGSPKIDVSADLSGGSAAEYDDDSKTVWLHEKSITNVYQLTSSLFHEYFHGFQKVSGLWTMATNEWGPVGGSRQDIITRTRAYLEIGAYWQQIRMGDSDSFIQGRYNHYTNIFNSYK